MSLINYVKPPVRPKVNTLLYGPPKTGKTTATSTMPGTKLLLNADTGNATLQAHLNAGESLHEIQQPDYQEGQLFWLQLMNEIEAAVMDPKQKLADTIIVDPVSDLYRQMLEEASRRAMRPSLPTYGDVATHIERFCRNLCKCPYVNVVIVCHDLLVESDKEMITVPFTGSRAGSPVMGKKLQAMVDIVAYTGVVQSKDENGEEHTDYVAQLVPAKGRVAGDRFNCLGKSRKLDLGEWMDVIASQSKDTTKAAAPVRAAA